MDYADTNPRIVGLDQSSPAGSGSGEKIIPDMDPGGSGLWIRNEFENSQIQGQKDS
jgi:hypothetical protein